MEYSFVYLLESLLTLDKMQNISIVVSKIDANHCKQTLASLP